MHVYKLASVLQGKSLVLIHTKVVKPGFPHPKIFSLLSRPSDIPSLLHGGKCFPPSSAGVFQAWTKGVVFFFLV